MVINLDLAHSISSISIVPWGSVWSEWLSHFTPSFWQYQFCIFLINRSFGLSVSCSAMNLVKVALTISLKSRSTNQSFNSRCEFDFFFQIMEANDFEFRDITAETAAIVLARSADSIKLRVQYNPAKFNQVKASSIWPDQLTRLSYESSTIQPSSIR